MKGFIFLIIFLAIIGMATYFIKSKYSVAPNEQTQKTTELIPVYPNAKSWEVKNQKTVCLLNFANCTNPSAKIKFSSSDNWPSIYQFYKSKMPEFDWKTNSQIVTSIPTSVVFENSTNCQAEVVQDHEGFIKVENNLNMFLITITCQ